MARPGDVISHWHHFIEDFSASSLEFYKSVEDTLTAKEARASVQHKYMNNTEIDVQRRQVLPVDHAKHDVAIIDAVDHHAGT